VSSTKRPVIRIDGSGAVPASDDLADEAPLEIRLDQTPIAVLMRSPGGESDLIAGFALTEGIVFSPDEIGAITPLDENRWRLTPAEGVVIDAEQFRRNLFASSSCGVCGKASIDAVRIAAAPAPAGPQVTLPLLVSLAGRVRANQPLFDATGGLHAAGLFQSDGTALAISEDIGRHNAVDKVIGRAASLRWPLGEVMLIVSGRSSFEVVQKAAVAGVPVVAGVSAASNLAAELATEVGMTLVGFVRDDRAVIYTGAERLSDV
jgi:FdhD protein